MKIGSFFYYTKFFVYCFGWVTKFINIGLNKLNGNKIMKI